MLFEGPGSSLDHGPWFFWGARIRHADREGNRPPSVGGRRSLVSQCAGSPTLCIQVCWLLLYSLSISAIMRAKWESASNRTQKS